MVEAWYEIDEIDQRVIDDSSGVIDLEQVLMLMEDTLLTPALILYHYDK